jgi:hypothetical protein
MVAKTDKAGPEPSLPADRTGDKAVFCGYDPSWVDLPLQLKGRFNKEYGGITIFGLCPRCKHEDGINVFIPTTWATPSAPSAPTVAPRSPMVSAMAFARPPAIEPEPDVRWHRIEWQPPDTTAVGAGAPREIVEVIACQCGEDSKHRPPSGKAGCGYWTYLRLQKGAI